MTTKSLPLTIQSLSFSSLSTHISITLTVLFSTFGSALLIVANSSVATAKDAPKITESVPPPPPIAPQNQLVKHKYSRILPIDTNPPTYSKNDRQREYTFSAPDASAVEETESNINFNKGYRVEVFGDTEELLFQVRDIEPKAFQKGNVIQVGIFSDRDNAENLVRKLARKGLWSRIISN